MSVGLPGGGVWPMDSGNSVIYAKSVPTSTGLEAEWDPELGTGV